MAGFRLASVSPVRIPLNNEGVPEGFCDILEPERLRSPYGYTPPFRYDGPFFRFDLDQPESDNEPHPQPPENKPHPQTEKGRFEFATDQHLAKLAEGIVPQSTSNSTKLAMA